MTPEKQRIAIAEACGWEGVGSYQGSDEIWGIAKDGFLCEVPDYLNDLNAMHDAEDTIGAGDLGALYKSHLRCVAHCSNSDDWHSIHATAAQRSEAFLRTIGRWEDEE